MIVTQAINVHLDKQSTPTIETVQSDTGRAVTAALFNQGKAWEPPAGATGMVRHSILHDGECYTSAYDTLSNGALAVEFSGNELTVHLSPEILSIPGVGELQVGILHNDVLVATMSVLLRVQRNIGTQGLKPTAYTDLSHHIQNELVRQFRNVYDQGSWLENLHHRVNTEFILGGIDQNGELDYNRTSTICSDFIYHGGREVSVSFPAGVKVRCLFYDADYLCRGETSYFEQSFTHHNGMPYLRLEASYDDDGRIQDPIALASQIGVFYHEGFQGYVEALECSSFRMCNKAGYYRFTKENLAGLSDAPDIQTGGILEVLPHGDTNVVFQKLWTSDGQLWFRKGSSPFRQVTAPGVFTVSVTTNGTADKVFQDIQQAYDQGQVCQCNLEGLLLPLAILDDGLACFSAVYNGQTYHIEIDDTDAVTVEQTESVGSGVFTVTYTGNEDEYHRIDKTFEEIREAIDAGKVVQCRYGGEIIPLSNDNGSSLVFIRTDAARVVTVVVSDDGTAQDTYSESLRHTRYFHLCYFGDDDGWHADDFWNRDLSEYFGGDALITPTCILHDMGPDSDGATEIHLPLESVNHDNYTFIFRGTFSNPSKTYCCTAKLTIEDINDEWGVPAVEVTVEDVDSGSYALPVATADTLGGVQPVTKTANMTQPVGVDANGGLWTEPSGEGGGNDGGTVSEESWQHLDTFDLSSGAVSYEIDTTGHNEIMLLVTTVLDASGCTFSWKQFPPTTPGPNVTLAKVLGGMTQLSYLGDGLVVVHKPRNDGDTLRQTYLVTGVADSNNTLNLKFATVTSGVINVYGR